MNWDRKCPRCNKTINYSLASTFSKANKFKTVCNNCRSKRYDNDLLVRFCPICNCQIKYTRRDSYNIGILNNFLCKKCFVSKWQEEKYGKKTNILFTSKCKKCGKEKIHKWKNISPYQVKNLSESASRKLCRTCSGNNRFKILISGLELKLHEILKKNDIQFVSQYVLDNRSFDVYLIDKNVLIEADGEFWHGRGKEYRELNNYQKISRENDLLKNEIARRNNIKLVRIWESEMTEENVKKELNLL